MHKFVLLLLAAMMSGNAMAEWVQVGSESTMTVFAAPSTRERIGGNKLVPQGPRSAIVASPSGNKVRMRNLKNFAAPQILYSNGNLVSPGRDKTHLSANEQMEYDCEARQYRLMQISYHTEKDAQGGVVFSDSYPDAGWHAVATGSTVEALWRFACNK